MVDVEQRSLRALEQDALALAPLLVEQRPHRIHVGQHPRRDALQRLAHGSTPDRGKSETASQRVVVRQQPLDLAPERQQIGQVHDADSAPSHLVLISRTDAPSRGADAGERVRRIRGRIELLMQRQDQRGVLRDAQAFGRDLHPLRLEPVDLLDQRMRIDHHSVADHRQLARPHHPRRQQRQLVGDPVDDQRVSRIVSTLEADDDVGLLR